jgi:hypothetical protein
LFILFSGNALVCDPSTADYYVCSQFSGAAQVGYQLPRLEL